MKTAKYDSANSQRTFMSGVMALTVSTVIVKIIGLAYKIPLLSILGAEGMGYFNTAYEIFALLCGVSTSGLPVAVSMLVSASREMGDASRARGIYKTSSALLLTKGLLFTAGLIFLAEPISSLLGNKDAYYAILAIAPALLFTSVAGAIRGYFHGCRVMAPTAVSQLIEAVGKLVFGVALAAVFVACGAKIPVAAAFAALGVSLGSFLSAMFLMLKKRAESGGKAYGRSKGRSGSCFLALLRISLPITVSSALVGSTRIIDMALILRRLGDMGVGAAESNEIYGCYTTLSLPVFMLAPAFIPPITESLIPRLSAAVESGSREEQSAAVTNAMRLTVFLAMPASMGIIVYSKQILMLLFGGQTEAISIAAPLLSVLGASVLFSCLITATTAVLQSYQRVLLPILSLSLGAVVKAASAYFLIGDIRFGAMGAPISTLLSNLTVFGFNFAFLLKVIKGKTGVFSQMPKPFFSSLIAIAASYATFLPLCRVFSGETIPFLLALGVAIGMYILLCYATGVISKEDIKMIIPAKNAE